MAIVTCPECGGKVSDQADVCIHCGYPLKGGAKEKLYDVVCTGFQDEKTAKKKIPKIAEQLQHISGVSPEEITAGLSGGRYVAVAGLTKPKADWVRQFLLPFGCGVETTESEEWQKNNDNLLDRYDTSSAPHVICPRCGAMDVKTGPRGYSLMFGRIGSGRTVNRCSQCGFRWNP